VALSCPDQYLTSFNRDAIERQLVHQERNKIRGVYTHHAEYLKERCQLMQWWGDYLKSLEDGGNVVPESVWKHL